MIAIVIRTCLTVFFLGGCSKNYIITSCVSSCFICYFDCRSAYFDICDNRSIWCDCCYREWISIRPFAKYFLTIFITFPSVAVCIVNTFIYIFECSRSLYLVFADRCIVLICDAVTICRNYIIITCSIINILRKNYSCFVTNNLNIGDNRSTNCCNINILYFRTCVVFAVSFSCNSYFLSIFTECYIIFAGWNNYSTVHNSNFLAFRIYRDCSICKIFLCYIPCKALADS